MYPECRHIHVLGRRCQSPALKGQPYCYFHSRSRVRHNTLPPERSILHPLRADALGQADPTYDTYAPLLDFPPIEDHESIQLSVSMILNALGRNTLNNKRAATMLYALQVATSVTEKDHDGKAPLYVEPEVALAPDGTDIAIVPELRPAPEPVPEPAPLPSAA